MTFSLCGNTSASVNNCAFLQLHVLLSAVVGVCWDLHSLWTHLCFSKLPCIFVVYILLPAVLGVRWKS